MDNMAPATSQAEPDWPELRQVRRAIVVVDVVESVRLMQADEAGVIDRWRRFVSDVRDHVLPMHGGRLVKSLGDGMLLEFGAVRDAAAAALEMQHRIGAYNAGYEATTALLLRVGVHVADVLIDEVDMYGAGVNLAARLAGLAKAGEITASAEARDALTDGLDGEVQDLGECFLRHLAEPVHAFRIGVHAASDLSFSAETFDPLLPTIAVIPPLPSDAGTVTEAYGEVIADGVIGRLSREPFLKVISRLSSSAVKGRGLTATEMGKLLGADYVLSARYSIVDGRLVVDADLCGARSNTVVWADRLSAPMSDPLSEDSMIVATLAKIAGHTVLARAAQAAQYRPLPNLPSYDAYLGALAFMHRSNKLEFERAKELLELLVDRHRRIAGPRAWLAQWYVLRLTRGWSSESTSDVGLALDHARRAVDIDSSCGLAYATAGFVQCHMKHDLVQAASLYELALDANPNESIAWLFKSVLHTFKGEGVEALAASDKALSLSPLDPLRYYYHSLGASAAVAAGAYDRAIELARSSLRANRSHTSTYRALAMAQALSGRITEARATAQQLLVLEPDFTVRRFLERSPSGKTNAGAGYAEALRMAGVPE